MVSIKKALWPMTAFMVLADALVAPRMEHPGPLSLPNLLDVENIQQLQLDWKLLDNIRLDTGRLIVGTGTGSLWMNPGLANSDSEWTVELVFRSNGESQRDQQFANFNALSLWFLDSNERVGTNPGGNSGGPHIFDGVQVLLSNQESKGLKLIVNDGSKIVDGRLNQVVGNCDFNYWDSTIPFTIRVSYSRSNKWFKIQVDNNLCLKTDAITIPSTDLQLGVTGQIEIGSQEEFEIMKLDIWDHLTPDAIDDHALMGDGATTQQQKDAIEQDHIPPSQLRQSLMERTRKQQELMREQQQQQKQEQKQRHAILSQLQQPEGDSSAPSFDYSVFTGQIDDIISRMNALQENSIYESKVLLSSFTEVQDVQKKHLVALDEIKDELTVFKATLTQQFSEMLRGMSQLNERVIGEVREHQFSVAEMSKKVDLLMSNHKEVAFQYQRGLENADGTDFVDRLVSKIKWIMIPLVIGVMILTGFLYRLRHDIKHSKLL